MGGDDDDDYDSDNDDICWRLYIIHSYFYIIVAYNYYIIIPVHCYDYMYSTRVVLP